MKEAINMAKALLKAEGSTKEKTVRYLVRKMNIPIKTAIKIVGNLL